jgi:HPt (histidine-containing phosphotransfer) domain-containing protein
MLAPLLPEFVAHLPETVATIKELIATQSLADLQRAVHKFKGAGGMYGFQSLTEAAATLDKSLKAGAAMVKIQSEVDELIGMIERVRGYGVKREAPVEAQTAFD